MPILSANEDFHTVKKIDSQNEIAVGSEGLRSSPDLEGTREAQT